MSNIKHPRYVLVVVQVLIIISAVFAKPLTPNSGPLILPNGPNPIRRNRCNDWPSWVPNTIKHSDCLQALEILRRAEGQKSGTQRFEFIIPGAPRTTRFLPLTTPRVYSTDTCTVAILMLGGIPPGFLPPGVRPQQWPHTDVETLDVLKDAAAEVVRQCVAEGAGPPLAGWIARGRLARSIGVFVFESGSLMDRMVRNVGIGEGHGLLLGTDANLTHVA